MCRYQTIQKLSEDVGIDTSSIRTMLDKGLLTKHKMPGFNRVFVDVEEFNSKILKESESEFDGEINLDHFLVS